jgi:hypothetical protein
MKRIFTWLLVICGLVAGGALWLHQSIHWSIIAIAKAAEEGDVARFERYVDLGMVADGAGVFAEVAAEQGLKAATGSDLVGALAGAFTRGIASAVVEVNKDDVKVDLRRKIAGKQAYTSWGPFTPDPEGALSPKERLGDTWLVELKGSCGGIKTSVDVVFTRAPGLLDQGWLGHWRATELRRDSVKKLVQDCLGVVDKEKAEPRAP